MKIHLIIEKQICIIIMYNTYVLYHNMLADTTCGYFSLVIYLFLKLYDRITKRKKENSLFITFRILYHRIPLRLSKNQYTIKYDCKVGIIFFFRLSCLLTSVKRILDFFTKKKKYYLYYIMWHRYQELIKRCSWFFM